MITKKRLFPILVAVLMAFAMMPMSAGTVFAEGEDVYTVNVEPGESGDITGIIVMSNTIISEEDMWAGSYSQTSGCFYLGNNGKLYYKLPSRCSFTAPNGKEFDCWEASFGDTFSCGDSIDMAGKGDFTITALWKEPDPDPYVTLSLPDSINVRYGVTQTPFDIQVKEALFSNGIDDFEVRFLQSSFHCTSHDGTIPFTVDTNATETSHGYHGDECYVAIFREMSLPFNCQGFINITSDAWTAAEPGTYTATLNVRTVPSLCEDKEIPLTLVVPDPATVHSVTVNNGTGSGRYVEGESVTITANEPESGKQFKEWTDVDGLTFTSGSATSSTATFTMPANDVTVTATYEDIPAPPVEKYTVTFDANGGSGSIDPAVIPAGEEFTVPACSFIPPEGKVFQRWNTLPVGTTGNYGTWYDPGDKITLTEDMTLYARWSEPQPAAQTITASNVTKTYGNAAFSLGAKTNGDGTLTYKSSNTKVATVSNAGKVTIKGAGTAKITISASATANYQAASKTITVTVNKAANPLKIGAKTAPVKYSKLKKKNQTLAVTKVIKFTKKLNDKKTYTLVSAKKGSKSFKKYFKINKTTGKVTIKKNSKMKKGTYKVKVKVKALGNKNYKASAVKTVTFKVRVK